MAELYTTYTHTAQTLDADCPGKGVTSGEVTLQLRQILKAVPAAGPQVLPRRGSGQHISISAANL